MNFERHTDPKEALQIGKKWKYFIVERIIKYEWIKGRGQPTRIIISIDNYEKYLENLSKGIIMYSGDHVELEMIDWNCHRSIYTPTLLDNDFVKSIHSNKIYHIPQIHEFREE